MEKDNIPRALTQNYIIILITLPDTTTGSYPQLNTCFGVTCHAPDKISHSIQETNQPNTCGSSSQVETVKNRWR